MATRQSIVFSPRQSITSPTSSESISSPTSSQQISSPTARQSITSPTTRQIINASPTTRQRRQRDIELISSQKLSQGKKPTKLNLEGIVLTFIQSYPINFIGERLCPMKRLCPPHKVFLPRSIQPSTYGLLTKCHVVQQIVYKVILDVCIFHLMKNMLDNVCPRRSGWSTQWP